MDKNSEQKPKNDDIASRLNKSANQKILLARK